MAENAVAEVWQVKVMGWRAAEGIDGLQGPRESSGENEGVK